MNSTLVKAFFLAHAQDRLEDMLALVHPSVLWQPSTPLPRSFYSGREGTLALFVDMRAVLGPFSCQLDEVRELDDRVVLVTGWLRLEASPDIPGPSFQTWITVHKGLLLGQVSEAD